MTTRKQLDQNFKKILQSIDNTKKKYFTPTKEVTLIAVSKMRPVTDILELNLLGQKDFAENYLNEALAKIIQIKNIDTENNKNLSKITWHFIGRIQSNKTRPLAENFDWIHSVDKLKVAQRLSKQRPNSLPNLNILIQVNIDNDPNKAGIQPTDLVEVAKEISKLENIQLRGLMCILQLEQNNQPNTDLKSSCQYQSFSKLKSLFDTLNQNYNLNLDTLSMGMSNDYEAAIAAGSTMIRIGSALFGERV